VSKYQRHVLLLLLGQGTVLVVEQLRQAKTGG
jgi:hypothetical protein